MFPASNEFFPSHLSANKCNSVRSSSPPPVVLNETLESSTSAVASAMAASVFTSGRRVTRSQQGAISTAAKKYTLRQSRSPGSDTEGNGKCVFSVHFRRSTYICAVKLKYTLKPITFSCTKRPVLMVHLLKTFYGNFRKFVSQSLYIKNAASVCTPLFNILVDVQHRMERR